MAQVAETSDKSAAPQAAKAVVKLPPFLQRLVGLKTGAGASEYWSRFLGSLDDVFVTLSSCFRSREQHFFREGYGDMRIVEELESKLDREGLDGFPKVQLDFYGPDSHQHFTGCRVAKFRSPIAEYLPEESKDGFVMLVHPPPGVKVTGVNVVMAATGDTGFSFRKKTVADPLLQHGVVSLIVMIPFYARRAPKGQALHFLRKVTDILIQAIGCSIEGARIVQCAKELFPGVPITTSGTSYGGSMATAAATVLPERDVAITSLVGADGPRCLVLGSLSAQISWRDLGPKKEEEQKKLLAIFEQRGVMPGIEHYQDLPKQMDRPLVITYLRGLHDTIVPPQQSLLLYELTMKIASDGDCVNLAGGHVTCIIRTRSVLPPAILSTLARLRDAQESAKMKTLV